VERVGDYIELDVPPLVLNPLDGLLTLVIRDFVAWWYTASISLGDDRFLRETRSTLNAFVNAFASRLAALDTVESSTYVLQSVTNALIREMREQEDEEKVGAEARDRLLEEEKIRLIRRTRTACEEVRFGGGQCIE
jgi:hypothetical protein